MQICDTIYAFLFAELFQCPSASRFLPTRMSWSDLAFLRTSSDSLTAYSDTLKEAPIFPEMSSQACLNDSARSNKIYLLTNTPAEFIVKDTKEPRSPFTPRLVGHV